MELSILSSHHALGWAMRVAEVSKREYQIGSRLAIKFMEEHEANCGWQTTGHDPCQCCLPMLDGNGWCDLSHGGGLMLYGMGAGTRRPGLGQPLHAKSPLQSQSS